jgi:ribosomal protein S18 acetylase RimI-like enzyme
MEYSLRPASEADKEWLDSLRREAYRDLFDATWGGWDEARHQRHFSKTWGAGHISIILVDASPVGMLQLLKSDEEIEVAEIQVLPVRQSRGLGSRVLEDVIESARKQRKRVSLYLGLRNQGAFQLYQRLGFKEVRRSDFQIFMEYKAD